MKTSILRLLTGAFALALLLAVGLSAQTTTQAQGGVTFTVVSHLCSAPTAADLKREYHIGRLRKPDHGFAQRRGQRHEH